MSDTLFAFLKGAVSNANDTDPESSSVFYDPPMQAQHNVTFYQRKTISLSLGSTFTIAAPGVSAGWCCIIARVIGSAKLTTVGTDWDGTPATGVTAGYGIKQHPGMICITTYAMSSFTLAGLADNTEVEYVSMILASDDQL